MVKRKRILVGGVFDIIHVGHIKFLWAAKKLAEPSELIVVVARDNTVMRLKGRSPIFSEKERLEIVSNLKPVDKAVLGYKIDEENAFYRIISELKPDIIALGYDQKFDENKIMTWAKENNLSITIIRLPKFSFQGLNSSSEVRKRVFELVKKSNDV